MSKLHKQLKIALSLAKIQGYDSEGRIKGKDGYIKNSSIVRLLNHAMYPERVLVGENEFITLLKRANIDPSLIINDKIRRKLMNNDYEMVSEQNDKNDTIDNTNHISDDNRDLSRKGIKRKAFIREEVGPPQLEKANELVYDSYRPIKKAYKEADKIPLPNDDENW